MTNSEYYQPKSVPVEETAARQFAAIHRKVQTETVMEAEGEDDE